MLFSNRRREMEESGVDAGVRKRPRKKGKWTKRGSPEGGKRAVLRGAGPAGQCGQQGVDLDCRVQC